jgi:hypothetical protein
MTFNEKVASSDTEWRWKEGTQAEARRWMHGVEELMVWLGRAGECVRCEKACAWNEECFIPMWPLAWSQLGVCRRVCDLLVGDHLVGIIQAMGHQNMACPVGLPRRDHLQVGLGLGWTMTLISGNRDVLKVIA